MSGLQRATAWLANQLEVEHPRQASAWFRRLLLRRRNARPQRVQMGLGWQ